MRLYHYCSIEALFSIVENEKIRFSDLLCSNDKKETNLLFDLFYDYCERNDVERLSFKLFESLVKETKSKTKNYGICLTEKEDELPLWICYAPTNGVAIEFDKNEIECHFSKFSVLSHKPTFREIEYVKSDEKLDNFFETLLKNNNYDFANCFSELMEKSCYVKSYEWSYENEWRCYFTNFIDSCSENALPKVTYEGNDNKCKLNYVVKNGYPIFHYELPFDIKLIKRIIIGPNSAIKPPELSCYLRAINENFPPDVEIVETKSSYIKRNPNMF